MPFATTSLASSREDTVEDLKRTYSQGHVVRTSRQSSNTKFRSKTQTHVDVGIARGLVVAGLSGALRVPCANRGHVILELLMVHVAACTRLRSCGGALRRHAGTSVRRSRGNHWHMASHGNHWLAWYVASYGNHVFSP